MSIARIIEGQGQDIITCSPEESVRDVAARLAEKRIGALPVLKGEEVAGIFSERDLLYCVAREGETALNRPVGDVMTAPAITIEPAQDALKALALMTRRRIRHLPVVENGKLRAFVSIGDIVKYRIIQVEEEAGQLRDYIAGA